MFDLMMNRYFSVQTIPHRSRTTTRQRMSMRWNIMNVFLFEFFTVDLRKMMKFFSSLCRSKFSFRVYHFTSDKMIVRFSSSRMNCSETAFAENMQNFVMLKSNQSNSLNEQIRFRFETFQSTKAVRLVQNERRSNFFAPRRHSMRFSSFRFDFHFLSDQIKVCLSSSTFYSILMHFVALHQSRYP